jgi:hypothetical protein
VFQLEIDWRNSVINFVSPTEWRRSKMALIRALSKPSNSTLDSLAPGACARVTGFAPVAPGIADRLLELGFDEVELVK